MDRRAALSPYQLPLPAPKKRRIGVLTSGGDAPGMNGVVRAVIRMLIGMGMP